jgi:hypothetical protein
MDGEEAEMSSGMEKVVGIARRVRTPLSLSGITVAVLYAIYRQVLSLNVFENIGANPTFLLLQNVLDKLFWLALVAIVLGVASYLITVFLSHRRQSLSSDVVMINASLDPHDSPYKENIESGRKTIRHKGQSSNKGDANDPD